MMRIFMPFRSCGFESTAKLSRDLCRQRLVLSHQLRHFTKAGSKEVPMSNNLFVRGFVQCRKPGHTVMKTVRVGEELNAPDLKIYSNLHDLPLQELVRRYLANRVEHVVACITEVLVLQRLRSSIYGCISGLHELKNSDRAEREDRGNPSACLIPAHLPRHVNCGETDSHGNRNLRPSCPLASGQAWPLKENRAVTTWLSHGRSPLRGWPSIGMPVSQVNC